MKNYIEIILLIILMVCLYNGECDLLADMMSNNLGKLFMLGLVVLILGSFGKTAGVLAALIYIFVLHQYRREGFEEGAGLSLKIGGDDDDDDDKKKKKKKKENFTEGAALSLKIGGDDDDEDDDEKEGFITFSVGGSGNKDGFWAKKNSKEGYIESMKEQISKLERKVKKLEKRKRNKKEGFANLRQNRRLKLNNISVLNTTDLDRIIKKDSEVRTLNSTS